MLEFYGESLRFPADPGQRALSLARHVPPVRYGRGRRIVTVSLRREGARDRSGQHFWTLVQSLGVRVLPNTAGCRTAKEAIATAMMARELFDTPWIKLEVIANDDTLQPDLFGLVEAAGILTREGFKVFPYTTEDLSAAEKLLGAGCEVLMPWGSPIGSGQGLNNPSRAENAARLFPRRAAGRRCRDRGAVSRGGGDGDGL